MSTQLAIDAVKMHGTENSFILIDERPPRLEAYAALARRLCVHDSEFRGADGLLVVRDAPGFAAGMRIFNRDGSEAEMCGNGVRCVARYLADRDPFEAQVDIGPVTFPNDARAETAPAAGAIWTFYDVSVGNPHAIVFVPDVSEPDLEALGVTLNWVERFASGTNVHIVEVVDSSTLRVRHYERGVGLTQSCGTGAVAAAAAAIRVHGVSSPVTVVVPGGTLRVDWQPGENARLTGPAETMFERTISL
jgi:diaminopimelate epimerase